MTAAIFGLIGVLVGALMNAARDLLFRRWTEGSEQRTAARLVLSELERFHALALEAERLPPENLPQLRDTTPILWHANRAELARGLDSEQWDAVTFAYAHIDALGSVLVFEPDGTLVDWRAREAKRLLEEMIRPVAEASDALRKAADLPERARDRTDQPPHYPVAA